MPISTLLTRTCTITRRSSTAGTTDDYGNLTGTTSTTSTVCELQQRAASEQEEQGELSDTSWLLVLPAGTGIDTGDKITVDGQAFEMVGAPWPARNPRTGVESHLECTVRRTAGAGDTA